MPKGGDALNVFEIFGTIGLKDDGFNKGISDATAKGESFGAKFSKVAVGIGKAAAVGLGAAATAFGALSVKSLKLGGELEQNLGGAEAVFEEFASTVQNVGSRAFETMGLAQSDFLATANKMGALMKGSGIDIETSMNLSTKAMQRAADVASIMGLDTTSAMESIAGAAKGNFTMMDNLGVAMNATTIEAYALAKGIETSYSEMDNAQKVGLAMEMFLEKTTYAAGNYAKENETLAGSLTTAKAAMSNFLSGAGDIDAVIDSFSNAADVIIKNIDELSPRLATGITGIVDKLAPKLPAILSKLSPPIARGAVSLVTGFAGAITDNLPMLIDAGKEIPLALLDGIGDVVPILKPATNALGFLVNNIETATAVVLPLAVAFTAFKTSVAISGTIDKFRKSLDASTKSAAIASGILATSTTVQGAYTAALASAATAEAVRAAAKKAGMTIDAAGNLITAAGTAATNAETLAILSSSGALSAKQVIVGVLTGKIGIVTAAQWAWNAAIMANPVASIVTVVAALTAGIVVLNKRMNSQNKATKAMLEQNKKLKESTDDLVTSINDSKNAYDDSSKAMESEIGATQKLADRVYALAEIENKTAEQKRQLAGAVITLNNSMEGLNLQYDAERDALNQTNDAINSIIASRMEQVKAAAAQERLTEIAKEQLAIDEQLNQIHNQRENWGAMYEAAKIDAVDYNAAIEALAEQEGDLNEKNADLAVSFKYTAEVIADSIDTTTDAMERQAAVMEAMEEAQTKALKSLQSEYETYYGAATDMFDRLSDKSKLSFDEMLEYMKENQRVLGEWGKNIATLAEKGIDEGLLAQMKRMGPEGAGYVAELVKASDTQLEELNAAFAAGGEAAIDALSNVWGVDRTVAQSAANLATSARLEIETELAQANLIGIGKDVSLGLAIGISENAKFAVAAAEKVARAIVTASKKELDIHSPSRVFEREIGAMIPAGEAKGIERTMPKAVKAAEKMARAIFDAASIEPQFGIGLSGIQPINYSTPIPTAIPVVQTPSASQNSERVADVVGQALFDGLSLIADMIFESLPKTMTMNVNGQRFAEATWEDYNNAGRRNGQIFAPTESQIRSIAKNAVLAFSE